MHGGSIILHHRPNAETHRISKVGIPGAPIGLQARDVTIAQALKPQGYATGQFGKNHLGDRNEFLPTVHGFDEFFGNLYHLNAEEEPERPYWPANDKQYTDNNSPRGVLRSKSTDKDDPTEQPHWGRVGRQTIEDTGPLTRKRMETIDDETTAAAVDFMGRQVQVKKPFFVWMNTTRMHVFTHVRESMRGKSGMPGNEYADGMIEHDGDVGKLLKALDDLGIANNTIVIYTTDNGPNQFSWPDAATTPFRSEKDTNWEGAFRVPAAVRWPGHIKPGESRPQCFRGSIGSRRFSQPLAILQLRNASSGGLPRVLLWAISEIRSNAGAHNSQRDLRFRPTAGFVQALAKPSAFVRKNKILVWLMSRNCL